jgi:CheY-like chemotaxis protein
MALLEASFGLSCVRRINLPHSRVMILLVEDTEDDVFLMERAMSKAGITVPLQLANDGQEAIDYLSGAGEFSDRTKYPLPSVIFLDLKLPFVHGFEVLRWIKQQPSLADVPVAILSSSLEDSDREKSQELGAKTFLVKPPTPEMLVEFFQSLPQFAGGQWQEKKNN